MRRSRPAPILDTCPCGARVVRAVQLSREDDERIAIEEDEAGCVFLWGPCAATADPINIPFDETRYRVHTCAATGAE